MIGNAPAPRHALVRRQPHVMLHLIHQQIERVLRVRLDELELVEDNARPVLVELDVVAVLDLVEAVLRGVFMLAFAKMSPHRFRIHPGVPLNRQQCVERPCQGDQRPLLVWTCEIRSSTAVISAR